MSHSGLGILYEGACACKAGGSWFAGGNGGLKFLARVRACGHEYLSIFVDFCRILSSFAECESGALVIGD